MPHIRRLTLPLLVALLVGVRPAYADATLFLGATTTPDNRAVRGLAVGAGLSLLAFEFEYAATSLDERDAAPSIKTGSANALLQMPFAPAGFQPYVTAGFGLYRERLGAYRQTGLAPNLGLGLKIALVGPLRLRVDYRAFRLGDDALYSPAHRIYAGVNLKF